MSVKVNEYRVTFSNGRVWTMVVSSAVICAKIAENKLNPVAQISRIRQNVLLPFTTHEEVKATNFPYRAEYYSDGGFLNGYRITFQNGKEVLYVAPDIAAAAIAKDTRDHPITQIERVSINVEGCGLYWEDEDSDFYWEDLA
jgi:hypothetical protein